MADDQDDLPIEIFLPRFEDDDLWKQDDWLATYPTALLAHLRTKRKSHPYTVEHVRAATVRIAEALEHRAKPNVPQGFAALLKALLKPKENLSFAFKLPAMPKQNIQAYFAAASFEAKHPRATAYQVAKHIKPLLPDLPRVQRRAEKPDSRRVQRRAENLVRRWRLSKPYLSRIALLRDES